MKNKKKVSFTNTLRYSKTIALVLRRKQGNYILLLWRKCKDYGLSFERKKRKLNFGIFWQKSNDNYFAPEEKNEDGKC